jgi:hypothetical protein
MKKDAKSGVPEVDALGEVLAALKNLDEKQRGWVIASAMSNLNIPTAAAIAGTGGGNASVTNAGATNPLAAAGNLPGEAGSREHARAFMRQKAPTSDIQRVACLGYYSDRHKQTSEFKGKDIQALNTLVGGPRFNITRAVDNAMRRSHYLSNAGASKKQMSPLGEDIVEALPNQARVDELDAAAGHQLRKPKKKRRSAP